MRFQGRRRNRITQTISESIWVDVLDTTPSYYNRLPRVIKDLERSYFGGVFRHGLSVGSSRYITVLIFPNNILFHGNIPPDPA